MQPERSRPDVQWQAPSPRMWRARLTVTLLLSGLVLIGSLVAAVPAGATAAIATVAVVVVAAASMLALLHGRYRSWGYTERAEDLLVRRGLAFRRISVVPYGRMQFLDVTAGPIDRLFGLATVQLHTAAAATNARIPGLARAEADRLRDRLAALGESRAAGL
jgi:membrane protein YdbS with pleckstrin-like domain